MGRPAGEPQRAWRDILPTPQGIGYQDLRIVSYGENGQGWFEVQNLKNEVLLTSPKYRLRHTTWFLWDGKDNVWAYSGDVRTTVWVRSEAWRSYLAGESELVAPSYLVQQRPDQHSGEVVKNNSQLTIDALKIGIGTGQERVCLLCRTGEEQTYSAQSGDLISFCGKLVLIEEVSTDWIYLNVHPNVCGLSNGSLAAINLRICFEK